VRAPTHPRALHSHPCALHYCRYCFASATLLSLARSAPLASRPRVRKAQADAACTCHHSTLATVAKHKTRNDIWLSIHDKVYNVTEYMENHPGGEEVLMDRAGNP